MSKTQQGNTKQDLKDLFQNKPWVLIGVATFFQLVLYCNAQFFCYIFF